MKNHRLILLSFLLLSLSPLISAAQDFDGVKNINGTKLFVSTKGTGKNLVVLHGGPGLNHSYFKPHLNDLEKNFRVIYFDQRACGKSTIPSPDSISINFLVDDLEALRKELKIGKLNLLAHSWGAVLATQYALVYPQNVEAIIYSNPAMLSREYDQEAATLLKAKATKSDSVQRAEIIKNGNLDAPKYEELVRLSFRASAYEPKNMEALKLNLPENFLQANKVLFTGLMKDPRSSDNLYDSLTKLTFPTLIIHGASDATPMSSIERYRKNLKNHQFVLFNSSGHFPFVEEPEKFIAVVKKFLR